MSKTLLELSTNERTFLLNCLKDGIREDGRGLKNYRDVSIKFGKDLGTVEVSLGQTTVHARISAEIVRPYEDRPYEGLFQISSEFTPMASPYFDSSNSVAREDEVVISRIIEKSIRRSAALDLESLCIIAGVKCWQIKASVQFLQFDGNLVDCCCIAVLTAMLHFRKPDVTIEGDSITVHSVEERAPVLLPILHIPISITFAIFKSPDVEMEAIVKGENEQDEFYVLDPTVKEETLQDSSLTITINKNQEICQIAKLGGLPVNNQKLIECTNIAYAQCVKITDYILTTIKADEKIRLKGNIKEELNASHRR